MDCFASLAMTTRAMDCSRACIGRIRATRCGDYGGGLFHAAFTLRHGERSEGNPFFLCGAMDCFASLAMTAGRWIASRSLPSCALARRWGR